MTVRWQELDPDTTQWSLAGRTSMPPDGRPTTDIVQFLWRQWANYTVNSAIREQLAEWDEQASAALYGSPRNHGLLAVAVTEEIRYDAQRVETNVAVTVYTDQVFASPVAARQWWNRMSRSPGGTVSTDTAAPVSSRIRRRFFWGTYELPALPPSPPSVSNMSARGRIGSRRTIVRALRER